MSDIRAGRAFVELYVEQTALYAGLKNAEDRMRQYAQRVGLTMAAAGTAGLAGLVAAINKASDQFENLNAFQEVFRGSNAAANQFADTLANRVGRSTVAIKQGMTPIGAMVRGLGLAGDEAARFASEATSAALDISSFFNSDTADAMQRIRSALSGSSEAVDQFGINMRAQALELKLTEMGFEGNVQAASELEKTLARLAIIQESLARSGAAGDLERTKDQYANLSRTLRESLGTLAAAAGAPLQPLAELVMRGLVPLIQNTTKFLQQSPQFIQALAAIAAGAVISGSGLAVLASKTLHTAANLTIAAAGAVKLVLWLRRIGAASYLAAAGQTALAVASRSLSAVWTYLPAKGLLLKALLAVTGAITWGVVAAFAAIAVAIAAVGVWFASIHQRTGALNPLLQAFGTIWQRLGAVWQQNIIPVLQKLQALFSGLFGGQADFWGDKISTLAELLGNMLVYAAEAAAGAVASVADAVGWVIDQINRLLGIDTSRKQRSQGQKDGSGETEQPAAKEIPKELQDYADKLREDLKTPAQLFADELQKLTEALQAGAITPAEFDVGKAKAEQERDDKLKQEFDQSDAGKAAADRKAEIERLEQSLQTPLEKFQETVAVLDSALSNNEIGPEFYDAAVAASEKLRKDAEQREVEAAQQAQEEARREQLQKINKQFERRYQAAQAISNSDPDRADALETETLRQQFHAQRDAGFQDEAFQSLMQYLGAIVDRSSEIDDKVKEQKDEADLITGSAREAAFGLGTKTVNQELLEQQKEANRKADAARELLDRILKVFED